MSKQILSTKQISRISFSFASVKNQSTPNFVYLHPNQDLVTFFPQILWLALSKSAPVNTIITETSVNEYLDFSFTFDTHDGTSSDTALSRREFCNVRHSLAWKKKNRRVTKAFVKANETRYELFATAVSFVSTSTKALSGRTNYACTHNPVL